MRHLAVVALALLLAAGQVWAAVPPPPADLGEPAAVALALCSVPVRVQFYDYSPPDEEYWRAVSLHAGPADGWLVLLVWDQPGADELHVWFDTNADGRPERYHRLTNAEAEERWGWSVCKFVAELGATL
mgnify:CR=1 FL=1